MKIALLHRFTGIQKTLFFFIFLHVVLWTLGPYFTRPTLPHDTLEAVTLGFQWQWGYSKHPFLADWLLAAVVQCMPFPVLSLYFFAQCLVALTFYAVWCFARQFFSSPRALIATLSLEGVLFYNINSFNLTPDTVQAPLWALLVFTCYRALTNQGRYAWLLTGFLSALCVLTKYQGLLLIASLFLFCLWNASARAVFKKPGIYSAFLIFVVCMLPHGVWLMHHHGITLQYAVQVGQSYTTEIAHGMHPALFVGSFLLYTSGAALLCWPFFFNQVIPPKCLAGLLSSPVLRQSRVYSSLAGITRFQWQFLSLVGLGPLVLTVILNIVSGAHYPIRWATPYAAYTGMLIMACLRPAITSRTLRLFLWTVLYAMLALWCVRMANMLFFPRVHSDAYLPSQAIAKKVEHLWGDTVRLSYVAGSPYLVSNIVPYMHQKPRPYLGLNLSESPWVVIDDLQKRGAMFIWDIDRQYVWDASSRQMTDIPHNIRQQFPGIELLGIYTFPRKVSGGAPIRIAIGRLRATKPDFSFVEEQLKN